MKPETARVLFKGLSPRELPKKQILIYAGDQIENLYYLVSGFVKVYSQTDGRQRIIFIYGPGDMFPFTDLSGPKTAEYFYQSMTDVEAYILPPQKVESAIRRDPTINKAVAEYTNSLSLQFMHRIEAISHPDARRKIISMLDFLVSKAGSDEKLSRLAIPLTAHEIASMCGLTRETASLQLNRLRRDGILSGSSHLVVDITKLEKVM